MPFSSASSAGVVAIQAAIDDLNGFPMGITGTLTPSTGAALKRMQFSKKFGGVIPSTVWATAIGDNHRSKHEYAFNAAQMMNLAFSFHALDMDVYAGFAGLKKFTDGNSYGVGIQSNAPAAAAQACVVCNMDAKIADPDGTFGEKRFLNEFYPLTTIVPLLGNLAEVTATDWTYEGRPSQSGKLPWGIPFTVATHGATRMGGVILGSDYPMVLETFLATGAETTYTLTYTPAAPFATYCLCWKTTSGVTAPLTLTSVTGKAVVFPALSAGDILVFRYEATDFIQSL